MALADLYGPDEPRPSVAARDGSDHSESISARAIDLDDNEETQFLRTQKRVPVRRGPLGKKTQNRLKQTLIIAAILLGFSTAAYATFEYGISSWRFRLDSSDNIEISGIQSVSRAEVMKVFGEEIGRNIFYAALDERKRQLEQIPWVESATVMRLLPNRLAIVIKERTPVAFARIGSKVHLIDLSGVVLGMPAGRQAKYSFPVIEGISDTEPLSSRAAAMRIYNRLVQALDVEGAHYSHELSEVDLSDPEDVKITAAAGGAVIIHLGTSEFLNRYKLYVTHIAEWRQQFQNLQSVDLRYEGQIVVNPDANVQGTGNRESTASRDLPRPAGIGRQVTAKPKKPIQAHVAAKSVAPHKRK